MFVPKHLKTWKPEHMQRVPKRRCHWCSSGPHRFRSMVQVLESPMRFYFCKDACLETWQLHRHDANVVEWLKLGAGERAKILKSCRHAQRDR